MTSRFQYPRNRPKHETESYWHRHRGQIFTRRPGVQAWSRMYNGRSIGRRSPTNVIIASNRRLRSMVVSKAIVVLQAKYTGKNPAMNWSANASGPDLPKYCHGRAAHGQMSALSADSYHLVRRKKFWRLSRRRGFSTRHAPPQAPIMFTDAVGATIHRGPQTIRRTVTGADGRSDVRRGRNWPGSSPSHRNGLPATYNIPIWTPGRVARDIEPHLGVCII